MTSGMYRIWSWRRRGIDGSLLFLAAALVLVFPEFPETIYSLFAIIGIWLIAGQHRSARVADPWVLGTSFALAAWSAIRFFVDAPQAAATVPGCVPYNTMVALIIPIAAGLVLVRRPLDWLVWGARISLVFLLLYAILHMHELPRRTGFGTNPIIAAYGIALNAILASIPLEKDPRWMVRVRPFILYVSIIPAFAAGSRTVFLFYIIVAMIELFRLSKTLDIRIVVICIIIITVLISVTSLINGDRLEAWFGPVSEAIMQRVMRGSILQDGRIPIWSASWQVVAEAPLFGVGHCSAVFEVNTALNGSFQGRRIWEVMHFHNMFLDIFVKEGLVGLILFCAFWLAIERRLLAPATEPRIRKASFLVLLLIGMYGLTGSVFTDEFMIMVTIGALAVLMRTKFLAEERARINAPQPPSG